MPQNVDVAESDGIAHARNKTVHKENLKRGKLQLYISKSVESTDKVIYYAIYKKKYSIAGGQILRGKNPS